MTGTTSTNTSTTGTDWYLQINLKARQLRLLAALDDFGNLKQVAEISHVTVPAVSKALAELENGLGLQLFDRTRHGFRPTSYGECLIRHARTMLTSIHQARDELRALRSGADDKVHIGVFPAWTSMLLPEALSLLKRRAPHANVRVTEGTVHTLMPELWSGRMDLLLGRLPPRGTHGDLEDLELLEEPLALMTSPHHPLAGKDDLAWSDLRDYPWVLPPPNSQSRAPLEQILERHGVPLSNNYIETLSPHLVRSYLHMTPAIAMMAVTIAKDPTLPLSLLPLALPRLVRPAGVMWTRSRPLTRSARLLVECLQDAASRFE